MIIYAYTTKLYSEQNWIKVGQTEMTAEKRVKQQDKTSNPEELEIIKQWPVPACVKDRHVHAFLKNRVRKDREWFKTDLAEIDIAVEKAKELALSEGEFRVPNEEEVDAFIAKKVDELRIPYLSRSSTSDNFKKGVGTALIKKHTEVIPKGIMVVHPKTFIHTSSVWIKEFVRKNEEALAVNGIVLVMMERSDY